MTLTDFLAAFFIGAIASVVPTLLVFGQAFRWWAQREGRAHICKHLGVTKE
jgi:hypothetical protein